MLRTRGELDKEPKKKSSWWGLSKKTASVKREKEKKRNPHKAIERPMVDGFEVEVPIRPPVSK